MLDLCRREKPTQRVYHFRFPESVMSQLSLGKSKIRFLLLECMHKNAIDVLNSNGYTNIDYPFK